MGQEEILSPCEILNRFPRFDALPLSHGYSIAIKAEVHIIDRIVRDDYEWLKGDKLRIALGC